MVYRRHVRGQGWLFDINGFSRAYNPDTDNSDNVGACKQTFSRKRTRINYEVFGRLLSKHTELQPRNPSAQTELKRSILRRSGYTHLIGRGGERVTIQSALDSRIGQAFGNVFNSYKSHLKK
jgi:hypothetical protein